MELWITNTVHQIVSLNQIVTIKKANHKWLAFFIVKHKPIQHQMLRLATSQKDISISVLTKIFYLRKIYLQKIVFDLYLSHIFAYIRVE